MNYACGTCGDLRLLLVAEVVADRAGSGFVWRVTCFHGHPIEPVPGTVFTIEARA